MRFEIAPFLAWLGTGLTYGVPNALLLFVPSSSSSPCVAPGFFFTMSATMKGGTPGVR